MKYAYYPGCLAEASARELDMATLAVARVLGLELKKIESASCCGAGEAGEAEPDVVLALNARTLAVAERGGTDILTTCGVCTLALRTSNAELKVNPARMAQANRALAAMNLAYGGTVDVTHLLWVLVRDYGLDRLGSRVVAPLTGLKVAAFYGCQILRPSARLGFDHPHKPESLDRVISALGAEPVDYDGKTKCCGFLTSLANRDMSVRVVAEPLMSARQAGADCIVTPCPMCHLALDTLQADAERATGTPVRLPILHLPQLIGLALGLGTDQLGLRRHIVPVQTMLVRMQDGRRATATGASR